MAPNTERAFFYLADAVLGLSTGSRYDQPDALGAKWFFPESVEAGTSSQSPEPMGTPGSFSVQSIFLIPYSWGRLRVPLTGGGSACPIARGLRPHQLPVCVS